VDTGARLYCNLSGIIYFYAIQCTSNAVSGFLIACPAILMLLTAVGTKTAVKFVKISLQLGGGGGAKFSVNVTVISFTC
jgi:hypothetical protein